MNSSTVDVSSSVDLSHIRAVGLDFDGTLIEAGLVIREEAREAMRRAAEAGIRISTASGRGVVNQEEILEQNGLGARHGLPHALGCDERTAWLLEDGRYQPLQPWNSEMEAVWERLYATADRFMDEALAACRDAGCPARRGVIGEDARQRGLMDIRFENEDEAIARRDWLAERLAQVSDELMVTQNWHLCNVMASAGGKGNSLAALARAWGLQPREFLAVGDRDNDVTMLNGSAGLTPAAVGNARPEIKELVRANGGYVATGELGAGVAEILNKVVADRAARG